MVSRKKMAGLIGDDEAVSLCHWPVAKSYWMYGGKIHADPEAGWKQTMTKPLADPNLFRTFSNLGARGDDLPEAAILTWVRKHGLLRLRDPNKHPFYTDDKILINQAPITPDEFRREARLAYEALTLFEAIRSENFGALRPRISRERIDPPHRPGTGGLANMFVDGQRVPIVELDCEPTDEALLRVAKVGLEYFVEGCLKGMSPAFDHLSSHPRPEEVYRPSLRFRIPDLYTAIWYQFARLITDTRPVKYCEICEKPIPDPRKDQLTCRGGACRQEKLRRKRADAS